jgi:hypothetical protein
MTKKIKSNSFYNISLRKGRIDGCVLKKAFKSLFLFSSIFFLQACAVEYADKQYNSTVAGYEDSVVREAYSNASNNAVKKPTQQAGMAPVLITNPFLLGQSIGTGQANNAYGSLNNSVIQTGIFMQNSAPLQAPVSNFGSNIYSPAR